MAAVVGKLLRTDLVRAQLCYRSQKVQFSSFPQFSRNTRKLFYASCFALVGAAGVSYALKENRDSDKLIVHPTKHPGSENGILSTLNHARVKFFKSVYALSANMRLIPYRNLQNVSSAEEEAKAEGEKWTDPIRTQCKEVIIEDKEMWPLYKKAFCKNYVASEDLKRKLIFEEKMVEVLYHNYEFSIGKHSYKAGLNQFSDWTHREYTDILVSFPIEMETE